jgi:hypothetical protein
LELGPQFAWHSRVHTPESHQDVAYCQAEATGAGSSDFAREKCGRRVEYVPGSENGRVSRTQKQLVPWFVESCKVGPINGETTDDSLVVPHIPVVFSGSTGLPPQAQYYATSSPGLAPSASHLPGTFADRQDLRRILRHFRGPFRA